MENYETVKVLFPDNIGNIDKMFDDAEKWGVSTLKGWIESYETTRFTQIGEFTAVITSDYNMDFVREWIKRHIPRTNIQDIN
jgi:sulfatase maturation enzyme AslB (radical SAM superfamily)